MNIETKTWLYDILKAINEVESFFVDRPRDFCAKDPSPAGRAA
jgi:hypothetical protein